MSRDSLQGFVPAAVTPFSDTGEIMWDAFSDVLDFLAGRVDPPFASQVTTAKAGR